LDDHAEPMSLQADAGAASSGEGDHAVTARSRPLPLAAQGLVLLIAAGTLTALLFVVPAVVSIAAPGPNTDTPAPDGAFRPTDQQWAGLKLQRIARRPIAPSIETEGRIALDDDLNTPVFSPYSGRVNRVLARAGDVVAAGAPLFAVQSNELAQAENDMVSALATLRTAHAQLELATLNERRQHALYLGHGAAQRDWQQSLVDLATAKGGLSTAAIAVAAVRNRLGILGVSQADIQRIEGANNFEHESAETIVRAPIAGTITQRQISPGQNIVGSVASQGTASAVFTIGNLGRVWMVANAPEADAARLHVGDAARVAVSAYPDRSFDARITYVSPVIDPASHRLLVRAEVPNPDGALKPDMLAQFEIATGAPDAVIAIPDSAIVYEGADAHVWLADPARKTLAIRPVTVGAESHGVVEIRDGLKEGDSIVTSGSVFIDRALSGS
jgi:cobalt-zinc-cadmium efflux system membrane fusion protein